MEDQKSLAWMLEESQRGNTAVFKALFDKLKEPAFQFIRGRVEKREDALDVMQEAFIDLWQALQNKKFIYNSEVEFSGFFYTIIRRKIARLYRFRRPMVSLDDLIDFGEDKSAEALDNTLLVRSLEKLGREDAEVVKLRYFSGLSFGEIAQLLGKGESAVKVRHHRALARLKEILGYVNEKEN